MVGSSALYKPPWFVFRRRSSMSIGVFTPPIRIAILVGQTPDGREWMREDR